MLAALALLPHALAEPATGSLTIQGPIGLPNGAGASGAALGAIISEGIAGTIVNAPRLHVTIYERSYVVAGDTEVGPPDQPRSFWLTDATIQQTGSPDLLSYVGLVANSATFALDSDKSISASATTTSTISQKGRGSPANPDNHWFYYQATQPHVFVGASGTLTACGALSLKILGLPLAYQGAENQTAETIHTGRFQDDTLRAHYVWLYGETDNGCVTSSSKVIQAAMREASLRWDGRTSFHPVAGEIRSESTVYTPTGKTAFVDGDLSGQLVPLGRDRARFTLDGDMRETSLASAPIAPPPVRVVENGGSVGVFVVGIAVGAGAVGAYVWRARSRLTYTDCLGNAVAAQEDGDHAEVVRWLKRAKRFGLSADDAADLAHSLAVLGRYAEALPFFEEAHVKGAAGDVALEALLAARAAGKSTNEVWPWIERALDRTPELLHEIDGPEFNFLATDPRWSALVEATLRAQDERYDPKA